MFLISVVISTYNCSQYIIAAVESVLGQEGVNFEVIVVDDGSTDNTRLVLEKYLPRIKYIYQENKGPSATRNTGIRAAKGNFIAFLDADDVWNDNKLRLQLEQICNSDTIGLVTCDRRELFPNGKTQVRKIEVAMRDMDSFLRSFTMKNYLGGASSVLVRRKCFDELGYFDETLVVAEDWDMWFRICLKYEYRLVRLPLITQRFCPGSQSYYGDRNLSNELRFLNKIFKSKKLKNCYYLRKRAYCYRYFCAAWAFLETGKLSEARKLIWKALATNPVYFLASKDCLALLMKTSFAKKDKNE